MKPKWQQFLQGHIWWLIGAVVVVALGIGYLTGDESDTPAPKHTANGMLGAAAVSAAGYNLTSDSQFADACAEYQADPSGFAESVAGKARPVGGNEVMPTAADVRAWGAIAC